MLFIAVFLCVLLAPGSGAAATGRLGTPPLPAFRHAFDLAPASSEGVYVLEDLDRRIVRAQIREPALPLSGLRAPKALARDPDGLLHAVDFMDSGKLVLRTYRRGTLLHSVPLQGDVKPTHPVSAAAGDGILWVLDKDPPQLFLYAYDGASLGWVDLQSMARAPFSVALGVAGEAFITDPMGPAVLSFSPAGEYLGPLSLEGTGITRPTGIAADSLGRVWVSDGVIGHICALEPTGTFSKLEDGGRLLRFDLPLRLKWMGGALWVLETGSGRIRIVELE